MKPTVIFDMDGVMIKSEQLWDLYEPAYLRKIVGPAIANQLIGTTRGHAMSITYQRARALGHTGTKEDFYAGYGELAVDIYANGPITEGIDTLIGKLHAEGVCLGLVSSSPMDWIMPVVHRLRHGNEFAYIESVNDHPDLHPKPSPDGYIAAMNALGSQPSHTLIIEDSQTGINAAIASGAHVCCFTLHHDGELPHGVETYAHSAAELETICLNFLNAHTADRTL